MGIAIGRDPLSNAIANVSDIWTLDAVVVSPFSAARCS